MKESRNERKKEGEEERKKKSVTWPGIEPGPQPWKGCMLTIAPPSLF